MAKKNVRDEPPKTQVTENAQLSDIVFILDKMELLLQAISDLSAKYGLFWGDCISPTLVHEFCWNRIITGQRVGNIRFRL